MSKHTTVYVSMSHTRSTQFLRGTPRAHPSEMHQHDWRQSKETRLFTICPHRVASAIDPLRPVSPSGLYDGFRRRPPRLALVLYGGHHLFHKFSCRIRVGHAGKFEGRLRPNSSSQQARMMRTHFRWRDHRAVSQRDPLRTAGRDLDIQVWPELTELEGKQVNVACSRA